MKLLSVNTARAIWLGQVRDLNPKGMKLERILTSFLVDTYKFEKTPLTQEPTDPNKGLIFENGEFEAKEEHPIIINLTIYNDGLVAESISSTTHSEAFLEDVLIRFSEFFKISSFTSVFKKKLYSSQLFVYTDKQLKLLNPKLKKISEYLSHNVEQSSLNFQVGGISFWPDQTSKVPPASFTFERALGVPFSENRYYSAAPLKTDQHLELLEKLENILS